MQQYTGTSQGWFMDTATFPGGPVYPLMNTTGMVQALAMYAQLWIASGSAATHDQCVPPGEIDWGFANGTCAMTLAWDVQFKATITTPGGSLTKGNLGVSLLPGSTDVMTRSGGGQGSALTPCSTRLCPSATNVSSSGGGTWALVNRAPFIGDGGYYLMVNQQSSKPFFEAMISLASWLVLPGTSYAMALNTSTSE